jgi:hypothetical protein
MAAHSGTTALCVGLAPPRRSDWTQLADIRIEDTAYCVARDAPREWQRFAHRIHRGRFSSGYNMSQRAGMEHAIP